MKKFLSLLLVFVMLFSTVAFAAETTYAGSFLLFDFGSESRTEDFFKSLVLQNWQTVNASRAVKEDSWVLTATFIPEYLQDKTSSLELPQIRVTHISSITLGTQNFNNGWGTYKATGYNSSNGTWALSNEWVGKNQFMKLRIKNMSDNDHMSIFVSFSQGRRSMQVGIFDVNTNDTEFQTYVIDMCKAFGRGSYNKKYNYYTNGTAWTSDNANTIDFHLFGSWGFASYTDPSDVTYKNIQLGAQVEVDYMIFAPTAEMAAEYKSYAEGYVDPETTTEATTTTTTTETTTETTTTESVVETTTTESVIETTTTESAVETTTTESVVETTTTQAVVDQTTTPQDNGTTTTEQNTDTDKDGGFPIWTVIGFIVGFAFVGVIVFISKKKK